MLARGNLGVELSAEKVPGIQRSAVRACRRLDKPVIVAMQMLGIYDRRAGADARRSLRRRDRHLRRSRRGDALRRVCQWQLSCRSGDDDGSDHYLLKLRSDQTDGVSVDLHQQRLNGDGRRLCFGHTCGRLRRRKITSRHSRILGHRRRSGQLETPISRPESRTK